MHRDVHTYIDIVCGRWPHAGYSELALCLPAGMIAQARRYISAATPSTPPHPPIYPEANGDIASSTALSMQMRPTPSPGICITELPVTAISSVVHYWTLKCSTARSTLPCNRSTMTHTATAILWSSKCHPASITTHSSPATHMPACNNCNRCDNCCEIEMLVTMLLNPWLNRGCCTRCCATTVREWWAVSC